MGFEGEWTRESPQKVGGMVPPQNLQNTRISNGKEI